MNDKKTGGCDCLDGLSKVTPRKLEKLIASGHSFTVECWDQIDKSPLYKAIGGALRSRIDVHGPITKEHLYSATKMVIGAIKNIEREG